MIKKILTVLVFLLVANAGLRVGMAFLHEQQFNDAVREIALFGAGKTDEVLRQNVMEAATQNSVPIDPAYIEISRRSLVVPGDKVVITVSYAEMIQLAPGYSRRFDFTYTTP